MTQSVSKSPSPASVSTPALEIHAYSRGWGHVLMSGWKSHYRTTKPHPRPQRLTHPTSLPCGDSKVEPDLLNGIPYPLSLIRGEAAFSA